MNSWRTIKRKIKAMRVKMGDIYLDQSLPVGGVDQIDPFLLIHHWKDELPGNQEQRNVGVGPHPHRGFSPVTLIFEGSVHHRDSIGNDEIVEAGGTQWMNSGKGLVHSERPGKDLAEKGGVFEIIQFWVNSPSTEKMKEPWYQPLNKDETPWYTKNEDQVRVGVVSGEFKKLSSKIHADSPLLILRLELKKGGELEVPIPENYNSLIYNLDGNLEINESEELDTKELVEFEPEAKSVLIKAKEDTNAIVLAGAPLEESVSTYGPFVMNTHNEIIQALNDFQNGKMGELIENFN